MATTTNYAWETPDDTDLVKDGAAAIRTLGSSIDTTTKALNPSTTLGDIEYRSSTTNTNTRLGIGSSGQVLTVSGGVPTWATPAGGGKVLQVVFGSTTTQVSSSTNTYVDTGLTATITPSSTSSKILAIISHNGCEVSQSSRYLSVRLFRNGTQISTIDDSAGYNLSNTMRWNMSANYLDSPASTSALTYKTQFCSKSNQSAVTVQYNEYDGSKSMITLLEIGA